MAGRAAGRAVRLDQSSRLSAGDVFRLALVVVPVGGLSIAALVDSTATDLDVYRSVFDRPGFWTSYAFSIWIAVASSTFAAIGAAVIGFRWARRNRSTGRFTVAVLQYNLGIAHLVWAVSLVALLSPSGWLARLAAAAGFIDRPDQFPVLIGDRHGIGIIVHLVTKEIPFLLIATMPLAGPALRSSLAQAATLGASPAAQLRHVYLPRVAPAFVPALVVVIAYALGAYEPAAVLGVQQPRTLAVVAFDWFREPDLRVREQAFALSTILLATIVVLSTIVVVASRSWWRGTTPTRAAQRSEAKGWTRSSAGVR